MRTKTLIILATAALAGAAIAGEMPWAKTYEAARVKAKSSGKLIMVDFFTEW